MNLDDMIDPGELAFIKRWAKRHREMDARTQTSYFGELFSREDTKMDEVLGLIKEELGEAVIYEISKWMHEYLVHSHSVAAQMFIESIREGIKDEEERLRLLTMLTEGSIQASKKFVIEVNEDETKTFDDLMNEMNGDDDDD